MLFECASDDEAERLVAGLLCDFPVDLPIFLELDILRAGAVPEICKLLLDSGGYADATSSRHASAMSVVAILMRDGWRSERSQKLIAAIAKIHRLQGVPDEYLLYAIAILLAAPIRWCRRLGWRPLTTAEEQALGRFWTSVAEQMGLQKVPQTTRQWLAWESSYQANWNGNDATVRQMTAIAVKIFTQRFPRGTGWVARVLVTSLLDDPLLRTLGFQRPSAFIRKPVLWALQFRRHFQRHTPWFRRTGSRIVPKLTCPFAPHRKY